jgi:hypothetical protein
MQRRKGCLKKSVQENRAEIRGSYSAGQACSVLGTIKSARGTVAVSAENRETVGNIGISRLP